MAGSATPKHYPSDPGRGANPPFSDPVIEHAASGRCFAVDLTRVVDVAAYTQALPLT